jgi:glutamyl-tRNA reductase
MAGDAPWSLAVSAETAPVDVRERILSAIEKRLRNHPGWVLLNTCHRVEVYGIGPVPALAGELSVLIGEPAVRHLVRVAAGLESAVVGEDEVLHQVRAAYRSAVSEGLPDTRLHRLFETAIGAGRSARAGRSAAGAGLPDRAIEWLGEGSPLAGRTVLVAGAGRMGSALAHAAAEAEAKITIASRDRARARRLAHVYGGDGVDLTEGAARAASSAGVAIALGGEWLQLAALPDPLPRIADLSAPSAVPPEVRARLNGGFLGVDDLFRDRRPPPRGYIEEAERIVAAKTAEYVGWLERRG